MLEREEESSIDEILRSLDLLGIRVSARICEDGSWEAVCFDGAKGKTFTGTGPSRARAVRSAAASALSSARPASEH